MEVLNIFKDWSASKIRDPFHVLKYALTLSLSQIYLGYTYVYLSAIDFTVITQRYAINFDYTTAQSLFMGVLAFGGLLGAVSPTLFISKLSRRYSPSHAAKFS